MAVQEERYIRWFAEAGLKDMPLIGGKAARLAELYRSRFPVPPGFVITAKAQRAFFDNKIGDYIFMTLHALSPDAEVTDAAARIQTAIEATPLPIAVESAIREAYEILDIDETHAAQAIDSPLTILKKSHILPFVAVRSSPREDENIPKLPASFLNVQSADAVIAALKQCYLSLFSVAALREMIGKIEQLPILPVMVQKMVDSASAGIVTPVSRKQNASLRIQAVWGLGESLHNKDITPDRYLVTKEHDILTIKEIQAGIKPCALIRTSAGRQELVSLTEKRIHGQVLTSSEIREAAFVAERVSACLEIPCSISFAISQGKLSIVDAKPLSIIAPAQDELPEKVAPSLRDDEDIESRVLKELENDEYQPGDRDSKQDIPPLV